MDNDRCFYYFELSPQVHISIIACSREDACASFKIIFGDFLFSQVRSVF